MRFLFAVFFAFVFYLGLVGQTASCGFNEIFKQHGEDISTVQTPIEEIKELLTNTELSATLRTEINVPVVVHVIYQNEQQNLSDAIIWRQIEILNRDFNGENEDIQNVPEDFTSIISQSGINFCLASQTPEGMPTSGIIRVETERDRMGLNEDLYYTERGGSSAWNTEKYLNIWVADTGNGITGFGTYPGQIEAEKQGVVVHPHFFGENNSRRYNLGRVVVHEVGHYFGLTHVWDNNNNCNVDDGVEDTPLQSRSYSGCPVHPQISCGTNDLFMNFMDYTDDNCLVMFTKGQMEAMKKTIEIFRPQLLEGNGIFCFSHFNQVKNISFTVFPNPTQSTVQVVFEENKEGLGTIKVYDVLGNLLIEEKRILTHKMTIDIGVIPNGIYLLQIDDITRKIIKY